MDFHHGSGIIVYDPYRGNMKKRTNGWCVVEIDKELTRYYRWWLQYQKHIILQPPSWDAHISVVRGERLSDNVKALWKKHHGRKVQFVYEHVANFGAARSGRNDPGDTGDYYYTRVDCPVLNDIRVELGLGGEKRYHLTFGRTYEYEARRPKR